MPNLSIDSLPAEAQALVRQMVSAVVDHPNVYVNRFTVNHIRADRYRYFVGQRRAGSGTPYTREQYLDTNIVSQLQYLGLVEDAKEPDAASGWYRFTDEALDWYRSTGGLTDQDLQRRIGDILFQKYRSAKVQTDVKAIATELGIDTERIRQSLKLLCDLGYAGHRSSNPLGSPTSRPRRPMSYHLTKPKGLAWANAHFPPIGPDGTAVVNVAVHVTLHQVFEQVEQLPIDQAVKERFELLLRRFEEEAHKEQPSYKPVQDVLDMLANVKQLSPVGVSFLASRLDDIRRMAESLMS